jgi:hypothetical protein
LRTLSDMNSLQEKIRALPPNLSQEKWSLRMNELRHLILTQDPAQFKSWDLIKHNLGTEEQQVAHVAELKKHFDLEDIVEIGGGYGALCAEIYSQGFAGAYTIFDFPEMLLLQQFYLNNPKVQFSSTVEELPHTSLLIAMWSLSEMPIELRGRLLEQLNPTHYFIAYQASFQGVDNKKYFSALRASKPELTWIDIPISWVKDNRYLIGI